MCQPAIRCRSGFPQETVKVLAFAGPARSVHSAAMSLVPRPAPPHATRRHALGLLLLTLCLGLLAGCGDDSSDGGSGAPSVKTGVPTIVSESQLRAFGKAQAFPVYWAGPQKDRRYELTRTSGGRVYIRYLTPGADAGSASPRFLTVGTYPGSNAYGALQTVGRRDGAIRVKTQSGALVVLPAPNSRSVYFAFPQQNFQVEVYDPQAGRARSLVLDGQITRLG